MKNSKVRMYVLLLVLVMMLGGCGSDSKETASTIIANETSTQAEPTTAEETTTAKEPVTAAETTAAEDPETTAEEETDGDKKVSLGRMEGGTYINEYVGFGCTLDENWEFYTAEELQEIPANANELFEGTELENQDGELVQITDMMAENVTDLMSINVLYNQLGMQERLAFAVSTEEEIIDGMLEEKDSMIAAYAQAGIDVESMEKETVTFMGEERLALRTIASIDGIGYYTLQIIDHDLGKYYVTLTLASYLEDNTDSMLELFYKLK